jgi:hypothetical protein
VIVAPLQLVEGDADLENALVQPSDRASLGAPEKFECLVLLKVLAEIELLDAFQELRWRRFAAPGFGQGRTFHRRRTIFLRAITDFERERIRERCWRTYSGQSARQTAWTAANFGVG